MFQIDEDLTIYITRGDTAFFSVTAESNGELYKFKKGDVVRMKVFAKKDCTNVAFQKDFPVLEECERVNILLTEEETKVGDVISKPKDYWYEVELNPYTNPQTIIGYDEDGAKIFKLFPEGRDLGNGTDPEDVPVVDAELDLTSDRPIQNQAVARGMVELGKKLDVANMNAAKIQDSIEAIVERETETVVNKVVGKATANVNQSEANAKTYMEKAEDHMEDSEYYSNLSKQYMEEAFKTTPTGYDNLVRDVGLLDIKTTKNGTLENTKNGGLQLVSLVGDNKQRTLLGKNHFSAKWVQGTIGSTNGTQQESTECVCTDSFIEVKPNVEYTMSRSIYSGRVQIRGYDSDGVYIGKGETVLELVDGSTADNPMTNQATCVVKFKDGVSKIKINDFSNDVNTAYQLEYGTVATEHEEYCGGTTSPNSRYPQPIKHTGDCVELIRGVYKSTTGEFSEDFRYVATKVPIPCKKGDVVKTTHDSLGCVIVYYNGNAFLSAESKYYTEEVEFTVPDGATHFHIDFSYGRTITLEEVNKITLTINGKYVLPIEVRDDKGNKYIEYIYLNEPPRKGDRIVDVDGVFKAERHIAKKVYNGTETWNFATGSTGVNYVYADRLTDAKENSLGACTMFLSNEVKVSENNFYINHNKQPIFCSNSFSSAEEWIAIITETNCAIQYELAAPIFEELDAASQTALNRLKTFNGVTYVDFVTTLKPSEFELKYGTSEVGSVSVGNENQCKQLAQDVGFLQNYVTPQMFGAKGDGVTDDTNAIQKAVNSHNVVIIPKGKYVISKSIVIPSNRTIIGNECEIINTDEYPFMINKNANNSLIDENINIIGLCFNGEKVQQTIESMHGIVFCGVTKSKILSCEFNCTNDGVYIGTYKNIRENDVVISNCIINNANRNGITIIHGNVDIVDCIINSANLVGIDLEPNNKNEIPHVNVLNSKLINCNISAWKSESTERLHDMFLNVENCYIDSSNFSCVSASYVEYLTVSKCKLIDNQNTPTTAYSSAVSSFACDKVDIMNNDIFSTSESGIYSTGKFDIKNNRIVANKIGILCNAGLGFITNNFIESQETGIIIRSDAANVDINHNNIIGNISIDNELNNIKISHNTIKSNDKSYNIGIYYYADGIIVFNKISGFNKQTYIEDESKALICEYNF